MKKCLAIILVFLLAFSISLPAFAAVEPQELEDYLKEINLELDEFEEYLASYDLTIEDFENVEEFREVLGPRVTTATLNQLLKEYELSLEELEAILIEYGEMEEGDLVEDSFLFISDIEEILWLDGAIGDIDEEIMIEIDNIFREIGITDEELARLEAHLSKIAEDPTVLDQLIDLSYRMMEFEEFESLDELTPAQIAELFAVMDELQKVLQVKVHFYLVKDDVKTAISLENLMRLTDANGASLLVEVYDLEGNFILDAIFTGETIDSGLIVDTGKQVEKVATGAEKVVGTPKKEAVKSTTVKGGKLPNTAGNYANMLIVGFILLGVSVFAFRKVRAAR